MSQKNHQLNWPQFNRVIEIADGQSILEAAIENDIPLEHACGGCCACTTCHIVIKEGSENISAMQEDEADLIESKPGVTLKSRLACQSKVHGNITIEIP